ncbi:MAG: alpha/beta hydrolase fold protein [Actinotalea sp.]|nr:alpha/beta hydrolase fold protein [Actinotalea sp.]
MDTFRRQGLTFDVRDSGPSAGPLDGEVVVCLHGYPQDGTAFDAVVPVLASAGLRVLVPDQRGYSPGARPPGRSAYALRELVDDVVALLDAAAVDRAHVVGHDWGGAVAWTLASSRADRIASLTALSTPHPAAMRDGALHGDQARRSAYMAAYQLPFAPEAWLLAHDGDRVRALLADSGLPAEHAERYVTHLQGPGALTAALGWYRAVLTASGRSLGAGRVRVPTAFVAGLRDPYFSRAAIEATPRYVAAPLRCVALDAGHWLPETCPAVVADVVRTLVEETVTPGRPTS